LLILEAVLLSAQHYVVFKKFVPAFLNDFRVLSREQRLSIGIDKLRNRLAWQAFRTEFQQIGVI
jgi:hypothetical protein